MSCIGAGRVNIRLSENNVPIITQSFYFHFTIIAIIDCGSIYRCPKEPLHALYP